MLHERRRSVTAALCALVILCSTNIHSAADGDDQTIKDKEVLETLQNSPTKYGDLVARQLSNASTEELQKLKQHENWGIALHAAWEQWVDDRRQLYGPFNESRVAPGVQRWLGFVEGRLGVEPPDDWSKLVSTAKLMHSPRRINSNPRETDSFWFEGIESDLRKVNILPGLYADADISAFRKDGSILELTRRGRQVEVKLDDLVNFSHADGSFSDGDTIEWASHGKRDFVVFVRRGSNSPFNITMIPERDRRPAWIATCGRGYRYGAVFTNDRRAAVKFVGEMVVVFSYSNCLACVEGFDVQTGRAIAKFHSAIW